MIKSKLEKYFKNTLAIASLGLLVLVLSSGAPGKEKGQAFAQLSSKKVQISGPNKSVVFFEKSEEISGFSFESHNKLIAKDDGFYYINVHGHAGFEGLGSQGDLYLWINRNGKEIPYTVSCQTINSSRSVNSISSNAILDLKKGDSISVGFSATVPSLGLVSSKKQKTSLEGSSVTLSIFKLFDERN